MLSRATSLLVLVCLASPAWAGAGLCKDSVLNFQANGSRPIAAPMPQQDSFVAWGHATDGSGVHYLDPQHAQNGDEFTLPTKIVSKMRTDLKPVTAEQGDRILQTTNEYFDIFGHDDLKSFLWTGIEVGNPLTHDMSERWNSLKLQGMYDPAKRKAMIASLKKMGIYNIRFGLTNNEIFPKALKNLKPGDKWSLNDLKQGWDEESWHPFDEMIDDFSKAGIRMSLDLHHFGIEDIFSEDSQGRYDTNRETYDPTRSFYLNPKWPEYFSEFSLEAFKRYHGKIQAITIINEPSITMFFNSQMWHGAFPGWNSPLNYHYYVERAIKLGTAAVKARTKIEAYIQTLPPSEREKARVMYLQSEAIGKNQNDQEENRTFRFMSLDTILGHDWIVNTDFKKLRSLSLSELDKMSAAHANPLEASIAYYIFVGQPENTQVREQQRDRLFSMFETLQNAHLKLKSETGQKMQDHTVLGIDYYSHNELGGTNLSKEPQEYADQVKKGQRQGMVNSSLEFFDRYPLPLMITETGTAYYAYGSQWIQQMLAESTKFSDYNIPFLGFTIYPAVDTWGWEHALSAGMKGSLFNESGLMTLQMKAKTYMTPVLNSLGKKMPKARPVQNKQAKS